MKTPINLVQNEESEDTTNHAYSTKEKYKEALKRLADKKVKLLKYNSSFISKERYNKILEALSVRSAMKKGSFKACIKQLENTNA